MLVRYKDESLPEIMWSCHVDTVGEEITPIDFEEVVVEEDSTVIFDGAQVGDIILRSIASSSIIGADDKAGCLAMLYMIKHNVPGWYVFHRDEETGREGSIANSDPTKTPWPIMPKACVAFDRKGYTDLIFKQGGTETASHKFASWMCEQLNAANPLFAYEPSPNGSFTDSLSYCDIISECVNVAIGYKNQHTNKEWLNVSHLARLIEAFITIDWSIVPTWRIPYLSKKKKTETWKRYIKNEEEAHPLALASKYTQEDKEKNKKDQEPQVKIHQSTWTNKKASKKNSSTSNTAVALVCTKCTHEFTVTSEEFDNLPSLQCPRCLHHDMYSDADIQYTIEETDDAFPAV